MLCISVVITSCAAHTPSEPLSSTVSSEELLDNSFSNLVSVTDANLKTIVGSGSEDGFYEVKSAQNGHYIYFTDYVSQQQIILCPIPNCQHNDSSCPGFLSSEFTDYAGVFICGDKLILSCSAPSHQIPVALYIMGLDGTEKNYCTSFLQTKPLTILFYLMVKPSIMFYLKYRTAAMKKSPYIVQVYIDSILHLAKTLKSAPWGHRTQLQASCLETSLSNL